MVKGATKQAATALTADEVQQLEFVDDDKAYYVTLQIGANVRWREHGGGKWRRDTTFSSDDAAEKQFIHDAQLHQRVGPYSGRIVNGLIAGHNRWKELNTARKNGGEVQRQLVVLATEETDVEPVDSGARFFKFEKMIRDVAREVASAVVAEMMKK